MLSRLSLISLFGSIAILIALILTCIPTATSSPYKRTYATCFSIAGYLEAYIEDFPINSLNKVDKETNEPMEFFRSWVESRNDLTFRWPSSDTDSDGKLEYADYFGNPIVIVVDSQEFVGVNRKGSKFNIRIENIEPGKSFALWSLGSDGINQFGLGDDIGWSCYKVQKGKAVKRGALREIIEWVDANGISPPDK